MSRPTTPPNPIPTVSDKARPEGCRGCTRRDLLRSLPALTVMPSVPLAILEGCAAPSGDLVPLDGASVGDATCGDGAVCIDLSDPANDAILGRANGSGYVSLGSDTLIVIALGDSTFDVLSAICTHAGCQVVYQSASDRLYCGCHGSAFDLDGAVIQGPAVRALKRYDWDVQDNVLIIWT